jgi:LmbE family N-acetylglucosaminyl deacetylase
MTNILASKNVLIISPHTDDGEYGCGGTISKLLDNGTNVYFLVFSICEESVPKEFPEDILKSECINSSKVFNLPDENLFIQDFPVRNFHKFRQDILEKLVYFRNLIKPDLVFIPSSYDTHQDHRVIHQEGKRAFKMSSILGYEIPWNNYSFSNDLFITLNSNNVEKKISSIDKYESQQFRFYANEEKVRSLAMFRGSQISTDFAEAFEVLRIII